MKKLKLFKFNFQIRLKKLYTIFSINKCDIQKHAKVVTIKKIIVFNYKSSHLKKNHNMFLISRVHLYNYKFSIKKKSFKVI
jgi:hypothetical protein